MGFIAVALMYIFSPQAANRFGSLKPPADRNPMPEFALPMMSGPEWKLSEHKGRVLLVNFWATWCPPCRAETRALVSLADRYRSRGFEVIGVTMDDEPKQVVPQFMERYRVSYPVLLPTPESALAGAIESLPTSILVDKQGRIARVYAGAVDEADIEDDIQTLLTE